MPLSDEELEKLASDLESDRVERKASASDRNKIRKAVCAFANDLPSNRAEGVLFIGVNDDGSCAELKITDELLKGLAEIRSDGNTLPFPMLNVQKRTVRDCELAVIEVSPSNMPPVRARGRVWVRVGPTLRQATREEETRLMERRRWGNLTFDQQPSVPATLEDLSLDIFRKEYLPHAVASEILEANDRPEVHQLKAQRFVGRDGLPNNAAVLLFGKDPLTFIPGAYVQFVRFDGVELTDPIKSQHDLSGPLGTILSQLDDLIALNISTATDIRSSATEIQSPDYPIVALRQLAYNGIMHRRYESTNAPLRINWFADRVEIQSPGGPYGQLNPENFGMEGITDYRNPLLAEAMHVLGFVQRFGIGIPLAREELSKNGNPELEFRVEANAILAIVRAKT